MIWKLKNMTLNLLQDSCMTLGKSLSLRHVWNKQSTFIQEEWWGTINIIKYQKVKYQKSWFLLFIILWFIIISTILYETEETE